MNFLTAEWRNLVMANWEIDPGIVRDFAPSGTEIDVRNGVTYASLVGFQFLKTRVVGLPIPFHQNFEEVNLRLYVVRRLPGEIRRGVVFIREFVPKFMIATTAKILYNENYSSVPMSHRIEDDANRRTMEYRWGKRGAESVLTANVTKPYELLQSDSLEEFIVEHYWGYCSQRNGSTAEYRVQHPKWRVAAAESVKVDVDFEKLYGSQFASLTNRQPESVVVAEGSPISVGFGSRF